MKLFRTTIGRVVEHNGQHFRIDADWDALLAQEDLRGVLQQQIAGLQPSDAPDPVELLAPIGSQRSEERRVGKECLE